jgi:hypothetical protein
MLLELGLETIWRTAAASNSNGMAAIFVVVALCIRAALWFAPILAELRRCSPITLRSGHLSYRDAVSDSVGSLPLRGAHFESLYTLIVLDKPSGSEYNSQVGSLGD